jgi:ABC-2 type transport system permease protein
MSIEATAAGGPAGGAGGRPPEWQQPAADASGGVIHDIGYRSYDGERLGRGRIFLALTWQSLRASFGIGRGARAKILPTILFVLMCLPAAVSLVALATDPAGGALVSYDNYVPSLRSLAMLIFVAVQAPNLVSADLRNHTLPLYFCRPIRRTDYPAAKLVAFIIACLVMIEVPLLILYIGNASQVHNFAAFRAQTEQFGPGVLYGLAWAVLLASIGLLLASTTGKRVFASCAVGIPLFITYILSHALSQIGQQSFGPQAVGTAIGHSAGPSAVASLSGLISPFSLLDGVLRWLQGPAKPGFHVVASGQTTIIGSYGTVYGVMFVVWLVVFAGGLMLRYQRVGVA